MNIRKTITSEIEWNTIKKAQADGKLQELLQVGDELDITLKTGEELTVQAVGTTERGLIFLLKDCWRTANDWRARTSCGCRRSQRCSARKERRTGHRRTPTRRSWSCSARSAAA